MKTLNNFHKWASAHIWPFYELWWVYVFTGVMGLCFLISCAPQEGKKLLVVEEIHFVYVVNASGKGDIRYAVGDSIFQIRTTLPNGEVRIRDTNMRFKKGDKIDPVWFSVFD